MAQSDLDEKKKLSGNSRRKSPTAKQLRAAFKGTVRMFAAAFRAAQRRQAAAR